MRYATSLSTEAVAASRFILVEQQHMNPAGIRHRNFHGRPCLAYGIEYTDFEFGIAEHTERYLVAAVPGRQVQND